MDSAGIDYHVTLAANAFQKCLEVPELQPELLCALVKQTTRQVSQKHHSVQVRSPESSLPHQGKVREGGRIYRAGYIDDADFFF